MQWFLRDTSCDGLAVGNWDVSCHGFCQGLWDGSSLGSCEGSCDFVVGSVPAVDWMRERSRRPFRLLQKFLPRVDCKNRCCLLRWYLQGLLQWILCWTVRGLSCDGSWDGCCEGSGNSKLWQLKLWILRWFWVDWMKESAMVLAMVPKMDQN